MKRNLLIALFVIAAAYFMGACTPPPTCDPACEAGESCVGGTCVADAGCGERITVNFQGAYAPACIDFEVSDGWDVATAEAYVLAAGNNTITSTDDSGCEGVFPPNYDRCVAYPFAGQPGEGMPYYAYGADSVGPPPVTFETVCVTFMVGTYEPGPHCQ